MLPLTLAAGFFSLFGGVEKLFGDVGYWEYPTIIFGALLSLLLAYLTLKFGMSLVKSSWLKMKGKVSSRSQFKSSFRNRHEQT
jgi:hypothetical protein